MSCFWTDELTTGSGWSAWRDPYPNEMPGGKYIGTISIDGGPDVLAVIDNRVTEF